MQGIGTLQKTLLWWGYWVGLGILSSVGLGTGLHTFLLYLVRFIDFCNNLIDLQVLSVICQSIKQTFVNQDLLYHDNTSFHTFFKIKETGFVFFTFNYHESVY